ncbi:MAG: S8 family serine peptidase, partial [Alphaproteobacteria bacterium]|nr:S8 family serine peptidase [Alphaproteobacteria bacterium]
MADHRNWKSRALRAGGIAALALSLGLVLTVWGSRGALAVTAEDSTPAPAPAAAATPGDKNGNRIADGLEHKMQGLGANAVLRVIVTMAKGKGVAAATAAAGSFTVLRRFTIINGFTANMTRAQIQALSQSPGVVSIYDNFEVKANRADAMQAYGVAKVHDIAQTELNNTYDGTGVGICIVDTGIFAGHSEFSVGGVSKIQGFCNAMDGGCFAGDLGVPAFDGNGHGTHVSSIAAGNFGVAPGALLWGAKVLDDSGSGTAETFIAGIDWCTAQPGVHVINGSLSASGAWDGTDPISQAANNAAATKVVVLAAGNTGPGQVQIGAPGAADLPITVGATADWLSPVGGWRKGLAVFSSRGPTTDDRIKPDIVAPGVDIEAAWNDGGTLVASGTSMASPFVAGVAALILDANSGLSPAAVKGIIRDTSVTRGDQSFLDAAGRPKNYDYGWGEIDAYAAVAEAEGASTYTPTLFPVELYQNPTIADGASWDFEFEVTDPNTQISVSVQNGGAWITSYIAVLNLWIRASRGQDFDVQLYAPAPQQGPPGGTLVDESTCEIDADTACGVSSATVPSVKELWGRQETLVADPADFSGGLLPLGTWRVHVEAWGDTDDKPSEIIDLTVLLGPLGGVAIPVPQGTIDGTVTDGTVGAPSFGAAIAGATVTADTGESTTTNEIGAYSLTVPAGERAITVTATGFDPVTLNNITVADGATVTENFALIDTNDPPAFLGDPIIGAAAEAGTPYASTLVGTASDPDFGDTLIYSKISGPNWLGVVSDGVLSGTPGDGDVGTNIFQVGVRDGTGSTDQATLTITVAAAPPPGNTAPSFDADPFDGASAQVDVAYGGTLAGTASDDDGDPLTYSLVSAQGWLFVAADGGLSGTPAAVDAGANAFTVAVDDGQGGSEQATLIITVAAAPPPGNTAPSFDADPFNGASAQVDVAYAGTLVGTASDADSDPLTYFKAGGPDWLSVDANGTLSGMPGTGEDGLNVFTVGVSDDQGGSDLATLNITVAAASEALTGDFTWNPAEAVLDIPFTLSAVY